MTPDCVEFLVSTRIFLSVRSYLITNTSDSSVYNAENLANAVFIGSPADNIHSKSSLMVRGRCID